MGEKGGGGGGVVRTNGAKLGRDVGSFLLSPWDERAAGREEKKKRAFRAGHKSSKVFLFLSKVPSLV